MKKYSLHILVVLLIASMWLTRSQPAPARSDIQYASFQAGAREPIVLSAGETLTVLCSSGFRLQSGSDFYMLNLLCKDVPASRTPTPTLDTATSTPTEHAHEPTITPSGDLQAWEVWHPVGAHILPDGGISGVHEHGQKPPQWVDDFALANFGHPLIYGGDERSSEMEVTMKHEAYGGFNFTFTPNGCKVEGYLRYHASSTPADRAASLHSFEMYVKDCEGNITINQGVYWTGDPDNLAQRMCRMDEQAGHLTYDGRPSQTRDQYIIAGRCENDTARAEQWYTHFINWDFSLTLLDATTFFHYGEKDDDPMNQDTWQLTGSAELKLRVEITSLPNPRVNIRQQYPHDAWWCAQAIPTIGTRTFAGRTLPFPYWEITGAVDSPADCPAGFLPQYNASTMPAFYADMQGGNTIPRIIFDGAGQVEVPN